MKIEEFELKASAQKKEKIQRWVTKFSKKLNNIRTNPSPIQQHVKAAWELSDEEIAALFANKFDDPHAANYILKFGSNGSSTAGGDIPVALQNAINKLPRPIGIEKTYRFDQDWGQHLEQIFSDPEAYLDKCFKVGRFLSTSANRKFAGGDTYKVVCEIRLNNSHSKGADLHEALTGITPPGLGPAENEYENEYEILFPPDTIFKIIGIDKDAREKIILEENNGGCETELIASIFPYPL